MKDSIKSNKNIDLDMVIIGKNEGKLLEKVFNCVVIAAKNYYKFYNYYPRIIYVDGNSTDTSVEIVKRMGIELYIIKEKPNPAKGRHLGFLKCKGKYIFFLDGDNIIDKNWLIRGVRYLEKNHDAAGVGGIQDFEIWKDNKIIKRILNYWAVRYNGQIINDGVGGTFLYRRDILLKVGDFNCNLEINEEFELYLRITHAGYKLVRLNYPMSIHIDKKTNSLINFMKKSLFTKNIFLPGVIIHRSPKSWPVIKLLLRRYWLYFLHPILSLAIVILFYLYYYTSSNLFIILGIIVMIFVFVCHYFYKGKIFQRSVISLFTMNIYSFGLYFGLLLVSSKVNESLKSKFNKFEK